MKNGKFLKYWTNSFLIVAIIIASFIIINFIFGQAAESERFKWDFTPNKKYSMTDKTKEVLKKIDQNVTIYCLFDDGEIDTDLKDYKEGIVFMKKYPLANDKIKIVFKDPDNNPKIMSEIDPKGTLKDGLQAGAKYIIVKGKDRLKQLTVDSLFTQEQSATGEPGAINMVAEDKITNAINYVTLKEIPKISFVEGHKEGTIEKDYITEEKYLDAFGFKADKVNLSVTDVPKESKILVFASPKSDLSDQEKAKVEKFLKDGGKAMFLFDTSSDNSELKNFDEILKTYNISLNYDKVKEKDEKRHAPGDETTMIPEVQQHEINGLYIQNNLYPLLMGSRSINILKDAKEGVTTASLLKTTSKSISQSSLEGKSELKGPLDVAAVSEKSSDKSKVIVAGDAEFVGEQGMAKKTNGEIFFISSINWLHGEPNRISIDPKTLEATKMNMTAGQFSMVALVVVLVIPLLIIATGVFIWVRRRRL